VYFVPDIIPRFSHSGQTIHNRILIWAIVHCHNNPLCASK
jgi:hypothetical protein